MPTLAVNAAGDAVAAWNGGDGQNQMATAAVRTGANGAWQPPVNVSAAGADNLDPRVAIDAAGNAIAIWPRTDSSGQGYQLQVARHSADKPWQQPLTISRVGENASVASALFDALGDATAIWLSPRDQQHGTIVESALQDSGTSPPPPASLTNVRFAPRHFRVGATNTAIQARKRSPRGSTVLFTLSAQADLAITLTPAPGKTNRCKQRLARRTPAANCAPAARPIVTLTRTAEPAAPTSSPSADGSPIAPYAPATTTQACKQPTCSAAKQAPAQASPSIDSRHAIAASQRHLREPCTPLLRAASGSAAPASHIEDWKEAAPSNASLLLLR
jgi:hypothetical protein